MAFLYIEEFSDLQIVNREGLAVGKQPSVAPQKIAIAVGSTLSAAFNDKTRFVRLHTDAICSYKFGGSGVTAANTDPRLAANSTEYFGVTPGQFVANIQNT